MMYDVTVIGGGVVGGLILRQLTKYKLSVCLLEKENDLSMGASRANSGVVHGGFDAKEGTLKARFNVEGNRLMEGVCEELGVGFKRNGSLVVAFSEEEISTLEELKARGEKNGVPGLEILSRERLFELEPNIADSAVGALYAPTGGLVCPYNLTIAAIGNAMDNGAEVFTDFEVVYARKEDDGFTVTAADGRQVKTRLVVNAAGLFSGEISKIFGDGTIKIGARRGQYILLDRESGDHVKMTIFKTPTKAGKGVLVLPTVDGNLLIGPTSEELSAPSTETTREGLDEVIKKASSMCRNLPLHNTITSFSGIRAYSYTHDFIIEESKIVKGLINCAGIESPGLTAAPAIAEYVVNGLIGRLLVLKTNESFNGRRPKSHFFAHLDNEEKNALIKKNLAYGRIVCRCERITEGEIIDAIMSNPPARSVDAVKRRTRAGMGRCQGGFCQPHVAEILADQLGIDFEKVTKSGGKSFLNLGVTK